MSKSVSDFMLSGICFYEQMSFMLAYCAKSIADLLKPCGDLDFGAPSHQVTICNGLPRVARKNMESHRCYVATNSLLDPNIVEL